MGENLNGVPALPDYLEHWDAMMADWYENVMLFGNHNHGVHEWVLIVLSGIAIFCTIYLLFTIKRSISDISTTSLTPVFIFTWVYAVCIYDIGMYTGENFSLITNLPLAILFGFKVFLLDSDVSELREGFFNNWLFSGNFALVHFLAACVTALFVIKHFGYNIMSRLRMWSSSISGRKTEELFVFWGLNDSAIELAQSIKEHYGKNRKAFRIIMVRVSRSDEETEDDKNDFFRILDFISMKDSELDMLNRIGGLSSGVSIKVDEVETLLKGTTDSDIIGRFMKLRSLRRIIRRKVNNTLHFLFLQDNEDHNLQLMSLLLHDNTIRQFIGKQKKGKENSDRFIKFYCHARRNSVHRSIEEQYRLENVNIDIVDSSHISVEMLKTRKELLPINYVEVEGDATVSTSFNSLIIGFGEIGQDYAKFLYEFGAFVKAGSDSDRKERSDFILRAIDNNMADIAGGFIANAPAVNPSLNFLPGHENPEALISLYQMDCRGVDFYLNLEKWVKDLNYVVVCTKDDELNITLAVRIFKAAARYRKNMEKFCVVVKINNDTDGRIAAVVRHYNRLWLAQEAVEDFDGKKYHQKSVRNEEEPEGPIFIFGLSDHIFTYANIIDDSLEKQAINYKERYSSATDSNYRLPEDEKNKKWHKEFRDLMHLSEEYSGYYPTYAAVMNLRRTRGQDFSNSLHAVTKNELAKRALENIGLKNYPWDKLKRKVRTVSYELRQKSNGCDKVPENISKILDNLAATEHIRWNASHEILGYTNEGKPGFRNEVRMQHGSLTSWDNLDEPTRSYDYDVVDLSLDIITPETPILE
ncbi:MAG: hypothetical protein J1F12_05015 [Muribaculaceae bacterium]|nr:hypothetical protein [Muribaculaceae bacterium]